MNLYYIRVLVLVSDDAYFKQALRIEWLNVSQIYSCSFSSSKVIPIGPQNEHSSNPPSAFPSSLLPITSSTSKQVSVLEEEDERAVIRMRLLPVSAINILPLAVEDEEGEEWSFFSVHIPLGKRNEVDLGRGKGRIELLLMLV